MYREVTMIEVREVLRLRGAGLPKKRIAAQLGLDPKTVRRYLTAAAATGVPVTATISDEDVRQILLALQPAGGRPRGDGWTRCGEHRAAIERWLGEGLRLTKIRKLLVRQGVERAVPGVRDDCFAGAVLPTLEEARAWGRHWCLNDYGLRRHSRTQRRPLEHFQVEEQGLLQPAPTTPYDIPLWSEPTVGRDQLAAVDKALYSIPHPHVGQWLTARADAQLVRFYVRSLLIKTHPRQAPGGQSIDPSDYPIERSVYAMRNVDALRHQAEAAGEVIGRYAAALLDSPLPWTRMRRVYALLGLVRRYV
jgi:hypothetical protein